MITRRAFSRTANLGQLYDAHNDMLLPSNILNLNEKDLIELVEKQECKCAICERELNKNINRRIPLKNYLKVFIPF